MTLAAILLGLTVLFGISLLVMPQRVRRRGRVWLPKAAHGIFGIIGFLVLLRTLGEPPSGVNSGVANFGVFAAWLIGAALLLGCFAFAVRWRRRPVSSVVIGIHATLAVAGLVMLGAYLGAG